jgi:hypothetical protein
MSICGEECEGRLQGCEGFENVGAVQEYEPGAGILFEFGRDEDANGWVVSAQVIDDLVRCLVVEVRFNSPYACDVCRQVL